MTVGNEGIAQTASGPLRPTVGHAESRVDTSRADRATHMVAMRQAGHTLEEIGAAYGVTRERARQLLVRAGCPQKLRRSTDLDPIAVLRFARSRDVSSLSEVAKQFGVCVSQLTEMLKALGAHGALRRLYRIRKRQGKGFALARIHTFMEREGRAPTNAEFGFRQGTPKHPDLPSGSGLQSLFGSMSNLWKVLGVTPRRSGSPTLTRCKRGHEFTPENSRKTSKGRVCKTCDNANRRSSYARKHKAGAS